LRITHNSKESKEINNVPPPKIIIAGSGMSQGGRIIHHEALYLSDPKTTLLMVTYQAAGTLGRRLAEGAKQIKILDQSIQVRAKIQKLSSYSSHADQQFLMNWLGHFHKTCYNAVNGTVCHELKKIFVVQGEGQAASTLAGLIRDELGIEAVIPQMGELVQLV
jgi:metallo-beta-lactamase family protein